MNIPVALPAGLIREDPIGTFDYKVALDEIDPDQVIPGTKTIGARIFLDAFWDAAWDKNSIFSILRVNSTKTRQCTEHGRNMPHSSLKTATKISSSHISCTTGQCPTTEGATDFFGYWLEQEKSGRPKSTELHEHSVRWLRNYTQGMIYLRCVVPPSADS